MFLCAGNTEQFDFARSIGIGLVESAICLTQICKEEDVDFLVFVGSAGSYSREVGVFELFCASCATQIEASHLHGQSYTPLKNKIQSPPIVSHETLKHIDALPSAVVNCSNYIHTHEETAKKMLQQGILLENMEFFSVLSVAVKFRIPARGIFCVSNHCSNNAHQEFLKNHPLVMQKLEEFVKNIKKSC
ncbi:phosphorylase family protein [Helicobacter mustelae]|uniref:Putative purine nucleoside phosphorylase n=1 Tax=Helicobacter mustelae (strain ATCC 43772 / CCUG 25715 / CIP 103759 / LMG 18044 / NCTC 12198 / R85-136P) TaxID=679897 RepID=D3UFN3_HELM1|nr:purine-nucleoside phosphorylase [Helicobacter mustelae]CBG39304.1 putative purine nucleoside phosphorylase [Helicobacter mustelae 12198]SQH70815.1 purine nucleoside phosphorylase [Helicobacter mustelae]STP11941.1 purine nucleoside phosphorylase [Helicobacter mustelae]